MPVDEYVARLDAALASSIGMAVLSASGPAGVATGLLWISGLLLAPLAGVGVSARRACASPDPAALNP